MPSAALNSTLYVREDAILARLDPWVESLADPEWLAASQAEDTPVMAKTAGLHAQLDELDRKISHLMDAIESGGEVKVLMEQLAKRSAERDALKTQLAMTARPSVLTPTEIAAFLERLGGLTAALREATIEERAEVYAALGIRMVHDDRPHQLRVTTNLVRVAGRVGGGTWYKTPRRVASVDLWLPAA